MSDDKPLDFDPSRYFYRTYEIRLDSGRHVWLASLTQYMTYAGLHEGIPWGRWRMGRSERFRQQGEERFGCRTVIVDEREVPLPVPDHQVDEFRWPYRGFGRSRLAEREFEPVSLGPITCEALFSSSEPVRDGMLAGGRERGDFSSLGMIWFQQQFAMPIEPLVLEKIKALDWEREADNLAS